MQQWQIGVESSIVVDIDLIERIVINPSILEHLSMILTGYVIEDFFAMGIATEDGSVKSKHLSKISLIYHQEGLYLSPGIQ